MNHGKMIIVVGAKEAVEIVSKKRFKKKKKKKMSEINAQLLSNMTMTNVLNCVGTPTKQGNNRMSPTLGGSSSSGGGDSFSDRQFIAITSEKWARVIALPSQNCVYRQQIADTDYVVKAEIISLKGE